MVDRQIRQLVEQIPTVLFRVDARRGPREYRRDSAGIGKADVKQKQRRAVRQKKQDRSRVVRQLEIGNGAPSC
jgi:hypothetical protein